MTTQSAPFLPNDIYAALTRADQRGFFHWSIYLCEDATTGCKFQATTNGETASWHYEYIPWSGPEDVLAVTFTKIGALDPDLDARMIDEYLKGIPMEIPAIDLTRERFFTCRVWFREAIRILHDSGMFVRCADVDSLEEELKLRATAAEYQGELPHVYKTKLAGPW